jgi:hypothetical protein
MITVLEIVDTGVKIGLGALISTVASYFSTKRTERHELRKFRVQEKTQILREIAVKLETSSSKANTAVGIIADLRKQHQINLSAGFDEAVASFLDVFNEAKGARTLASLLKEKKLASLTLEFMNSVETLRVHYFVKRENYIDTFIVETIEARTGIREQILDELGNVFERIYS